MRQLKSIVLAAGILSLLAACTSTPIEKPVETIAPPVAAPAPKVEPKVAPAPAPAPVVQVAPYLDPANALYTKRSVFFDFDQFVIKPEGNAVLENHAKFLASNPKVIVRIEGNADEQGSKEYNIALGQKRAESVAKTLRILGVKDAQMEAVSFGEEKPQALGHDEASRAQNRRADIAYPSK